MKVYSSSLVWLTVVLFSCTSIYAQDKSITIEDMAKWKYIDRHDLSHSGQYVLYDIKSEDGNPSCCFHNTLTGTTSCFERSYDIKINADETWLVYTTKPDEDEVDSLLRSGTKKDDLPPDTLKVLDLKKGTEFEIADVTKHQMNDSFPDVLIYQLGSIPKMEGDTTESSAREMNEDNGHHLIARHMLSGQEDTIYFVTKWELSEVGQHLAALTTGRDSTDQAGIIIYNLASRGQKKVRQTEGKLEQVVSDKTGQQFVFILDEDTTKAYIRPYKLWYWADVMDSLSLAVDFPTDQLMKGSQVVGAYEPRFSEDGKRLIFGYNLPPARQDTSLLEKEMVDVEIWSTDDPLIYPMQNERVDELRDKAFHAIWEPRVDRIVKLTDTLVDHLILNKKINGAYAGAYHNEIYLHNIVFTGHDYKDLYGVDLNTGERWLIEKEVHGYPRLSPSGELLYWHNPSKGHWRAHNLRTRKSYTWTNQDIGKFEDEEHDHPRPPYAYGVAGFSPDEKHVYIYDRYDVWEFDTRADLSGSKMTNGRASELRVRIVNMDQEADYLNPNGQWLFLFSERDKSTGYGWLDMEIQKITEQVTEPMFYDFRPTLSRDSSTVVYTKEDYRTFPDLLVADLDNWKNAQQITDLQSQANGFAWGTIEHVEWDGNEGMLVLPEDHQEGDEHPLIVNFYEKSSDGLHRYRRPYLHRSTINYPHYASRGYAIFNPDIVYQIGDPGKSALEIVESGVRHLIEKGIVDEAKIALQGHSWGGYQVAHIITKSDLFTCAESGAPVVNMTSAYGGIRWGSGMSRMFQYEQTQSRLGRTLWEDREVYLRNSPLFDVDKIDIPVLILHNDEDQAVPWYQGIEFYMALRRLGKKAWMLNYRDEPHWPVKFQNRKDFQTRMMQFFDHYMLGESMPLWMSEGIPAHLRGIESGLD
ncbi:MAG: prolyl oligopeptidase family serine peptidase [Saprospiraceae bacterium]|nr:prolyl oligopeptidase family serine peptidase [Saprospiraceae bacterium]